jgi:L-aspartate semialdehyde sulfurtransferase ferredoxin
MGMGKQRVKFTFSEEKVKEPVIYRLGQNFKVVTNIRRADVSENIGWVVLELDGDAEEIEKGLAWVSSTGVRVDPVSGDVVDG